MDNQEITLIETISGHTSRFLSREAARAYLEKSTGGDPYRKLLLEETLKELESGKTELTYTHYDVIKE